MLDQAVIDRGGADRDVDVLIVGAGPVGLMIANLLGVHGVSTLVIERAPGLAGAPRAVALDDEGMRTLQMAGLVEAAAPQMLLGYGHHLYGRRGQLLLRIDPPGREHGFAKRNRFHQPLLEQCLFDGLTRFDTVHVVFGQSLTGLEADDRGVRATTENGTGAGRITARYVVGADGGSSTVRRLTEIAMTGESHPEPWIVIDTEDNPDTARYSRAVGDPRRPNVNVPGVDGRRRYEFMLLPDEDPVEAASDASVARLLAPLCDLSQVRVTRQTVYTFHSLIAERFSAGRVFLAGDAAHMMPPFQGQGLNSGMRDAAMLAWRLAAVLQGRLNAGVLRSYDTERRPHAQDMIRLSHRVGRILMTRNPAKALLRDLAFAAMARLPGTGAYLRNMGFKPKPEAADGFFLRDCGGLAGKLFPQPDVLTPQGQRVPLDSVLGRGFALLHLRRQGSDPRVEYQHPLWRTLDPQHVLALPGGVAGRPDGLTSVSDIGGLLQSAAGGLGEASLLLRPDRYLAAVIPLGGASGAAEQLAAAGAP